MTREGQLVIHGYAGIRTLVISVYVFASVIHAQAGIQKKLGMTKNKGMAKMR